MTKRLLKNVAIGCMMVMGLTWSVPAAAQSPAFRRTDRVLAYDTDIWRVWVPAGQPVRVVVDGQSHTDLDLTVFDAATGELLAVDDDGTSYCVGQFRTSFGGGYWRLIEIRIDNLGGYSNTYRLTVRY